MFSQLFVKYGFDMARKTCSLCWFRYTMITRTDTHISSNVLHPLWHCSGVIR